MSQVGDMQLAYNLSHQRIMDTREDGLALWATTRQQWERTIRQSWHERGFEAPPMVYDGLIRRISPPIPAPDPTAHVDLLTALMTDYTPRFLEHIVYRLKNKGNVVIEFTGPTGMGKSSSATALANWIKLIPPAKLLDHFVFDLNDLSSRLGNKGVGETVIIDEYIEQSGDGSRTVQNLITNVEDTIRASGINLFWCSPSKHDHSTSQCELELILWSPSGKKSLFLCWMDGLPLGTVQLAWMPDALWNVYSPWKKANVNRSVEGKFRDSHVLGKQMMRLFANDDFVQFLLATNKPKKGSFEDAVELFNPFPLATRQRDRLVSIMHVVCYGWDRFEPKFERYFGVPPNDGLRELAKKCYQE